MLISSLVFRTSVALAVYRETIVAGTVPTMEVVSKILGCLQIPRDDSLKSRLVENLEVIADSSRYSSLSSLIDGFGEYDPRAFSLLEVSNVQLQSASSLCSNFENRGYSSNACDTLL